MMLQAVFSNGGPRPTENEIGKIILTKRTLTDNRDRHLWAAPVGVTSLPGPGVASADDDVNFSLANA